MLPPACQSHSCQPSPCVRKNTQGNYANGWLMKCLLCASCDSLRAVLPCRIWFGYWLLELSDRLALGSVRNPGVYWSAWCQRSSEVVKQMLHLLICHFKKHLHKLCHVNNCCIRVPMIVEQHCVVIACATVTCGAWYGTFCWLLHCLWFISWSPFSTWINCIIFHKVIQSCVLRWQI